MTSRIRPPFDKEATSTMTHPIYSVESALLQALIAEGPLTCSRAAAYCGISMSTLRRAVWRLEACKLILRTPPSDHLHRTSPRNRLITPTDRELIAILDLSVPSPTYRLLTPRLCTMGVGSMPYNHTLTPADNLAHLVHRLYTLRQAIDPAHDRPLITALLLPDHPPAAQGLTTPWSDIAAHPQRYTELLAALTEPDTALPPPLRLCLTEALAAAWELHPHLADQSSLLYLRTAPTPLAALFLRTGSKEPWTPLVHCAPLTGTLIAYLSTPASMVDNLRRFLGDSRAFVRPDAVILEAPPTADLSPGALRLQLAPSIPLYIHTLEPHILTRAHLGAAYRALHTLWLHRLHRQSTD